MCVCGGGGRADTVHIIRHKTVHSPWFGLGTCPDSRVTGAVSAERSAPPTGALRSTWAPGTSSASAVKGSSLEFVRRTSPCCRKNINIDVISYTSTTK